MCIVWVRNEIIMCDATKEFLLDIDMAMFYNKRYANKRLRKRYYSSRKR